MFKAGEIAKLIGIRYVGTYIIDLLRKTANYYILNNGWITHMPFGSIGNINDLNHYSRVA